MTYFTDTYDQSSLKNRYRKLAMLYHPDKGGQLELMQKINYEYSSIKDIIGKPPPELKKIRPGNLIYVNKSKCIVLEVEQKLFKAKSITTRREAYFDKETGMGLFNFKLRASIYSPY